MGDTGLGREDILAAVGSFVGVLVGSLGVGVVLAVLMGAVIRRSALKENLVLEQGLVVLFVYMPYVVGECCSLSGIVTTLTSGMAARKFIYPLVPAHCPGCRADRDTTPGVGI